MIKPFLLDAEFWDTLYTCINLMKIRSTFMCKFIYINRNYFINFMKKLCFRQLLILCFLDVSSQPESFDT